MRSDIRRRSPVHGVAFVSSKIEGVISRGTQRRGTSSASLWTNNQRHKVSRSFNALPSSLRSLFLFRLLFSFFFYFFFLSFFFFSLAVEHTESCVGAGYKLYLEGRMESCVCLQDRNGFSATL